ncbi:MAG: endonuclease/exonuclease/phosphatase family protein [Saprospiraceae bacterium]|nr:endonuclease/exonuclease/phosphatase family protein [Saprospiraceae bacterium]
MKFLKKSILVLNIVLVIGLVFAYLSPHFDPNEIWIFSIFGLFYPILLLANLAMVLIWMFVDFKFLFISLFIIILGWSHLQGFINFSAGSKQSSDLKILTYNVGFSYPLRSGPNKTRSQNKEALKSFFQDHSDVDVFCLQESSSFSRKILESNFSEFYDHEVEERGTFIFSKYPIIRHGEISFGTRTNSCIWADINLGKDTVRLYNMHLQSNKVSRDAVEVMDNVNLQEKKTWDGIRGILSKYRATNKIRAKQSKQVAQHASTSRHPTIICGDGNDPPSSFTYRQLCADMQDSFIQAGSGIGTTYAGKIPMLRIDYIFVDAQFDVASFEILKEDFSDHYAVKGSYKLRD